MIWEGSGRAHFLLDAFLHVFGSYCAGHRLAFGGGGGLTKYIVYTKASTLTILIGTLIA